MGWVNNTEWDEALQTADRRIVPGGGKGTEFLFRPDELICDAVMWTEPRNAEEDEVGGRLREAGADEVERDDTRAGEADRLGLRLLRIATDAALEVIRATRAIAPDTLAFNHVLVADPQRYGGCAPPVALNPPVAQIPGPGEEGAAFKVAVLDTGIAPGTQFAIDPASDIETGPAGHASGHGTMVAGVIARYAPRATILAKQVLSLPLGVADELEVARALAAIPHDVHLVNASFGGPAADRVSMLALRRALDDLPEHMVVVAAAGNEGSEREHYMAAFDRVVGVASVEDGGIPNYSNRGEWVRACSQGTDVETRRAADEAVLATGTSFAAPKVSARILEDAAGAGGVEAARDALLAGGPAVPDGGTFVDVP